MNGIFKAVSDQTQPLIKEIATLNPTNPFYTAQYMSYKRNQGFIPWILVDSTHTQPDVCCPAYIKTGRLRSLLEIPSMPNIPVDDHFWLELINFCRQKGISDLSVDSFCSQGGEIPQLDHETNRKARWEFLIPLEHPDIFIKLSKGHAYRIKRARKIGVEMKHTCDQEAVKVHAQLIGASMQRRQDRGENVTTSAPIDDFLQIIESGAGELFQAVLANQVVSSNLILIADKAGYSHTQGTSPEGRDCGAAHFLIHEIACALRQEGKEILNLGGTDDLNLESGLVKFKTGFGATVKRFELEAASFKPDNILSCWLRRFSIFSKEYA